METTLLKRRIKKVGQAQSTDGKCVIYVMSRDQRIADNHALLAAQKHALAKKVPLAVVFCLYEKSGYRAKEHYEWMLAGLKELEDRLKAFNIPFMLLIGDPRQRILALMHHTQPGAVYFDFSPLAGPRALVEYIAHAENSPPVYVVDTHNCIPLWELSDKQEVAAYTIRPKVHRTLGTFLVEPDTLEKHPHNWPGEVRSIGDLQNRIDELFDKLPSNSSQIPFKSGMSAAHEQLDVFVDTRLRQYAVMRNIPTEQYVSDLSPYLHFGQISSLRVALKLQEIVANLGNELHLLNSPRMPQAGGEPSVTNGANAVLEEMIVRKELSDNFCFYQRHYRTLKGGPQWAQASLSEHVNDPREFLYSYEQLAAGQTHDAAWNAAQVQMVRTGKMHGYMRMYWAKKVLEWTESPEQAIDFLIELNDFYSLDGGDPNGYVGILWSVTGVHDRPWTERAVFGKIRYMNYSGLKRKFDITSYEKQWLRK